MKSIKELSESVGISKESIYKKIKYQLKIELKDHVFKGTGGTLIDEIGESLILQSLRKERVTQTEEIVAETNIDSSDNTISNSTFKQPDIVKDNQVENFDFISVLKQQLSEKDKQIVSLMNSKDEQIQNKDLQIEHLLKINEQLINTFQNEQRIKVASTLQLQDSSDTQQTVDTTQRKPIESPKKSFWDKIFKK